MKLSALKDKHKVQMMVAGLVIESAIEAYLVRLELVLEILVFIWLLFVNYVFWFNSNLYNKFISNYIERSDKSPMELGPWKEVIQHRYFIWFPRIVFLFSALFFVYTSIY
jgi:hypothetical protein